MGENTVVHCVACIAIHRRDPTMCQMVLTCQSKKKKKTGKARERPRWGTEKEWKRNMSDEPSYSTVVPGLGNLAFVRHAATNPVSCDTTHLA